MEVSGHPDSPVVIIPNKVLTTVKYPSPAMHSALDKSILSHFDLHTYIHSIALDQALASLTGFMIVKYIRCGVISPTINLLLTT
jgi:hypothetical protein